MPQNAAFADFKNLLTAGTPELGPGPRPNVSGIKILTEKLAGLFTQNDIPAHQADLTRALIFLWHDHLDEAHTISQAIESLDGSFIHGIVHRREPDYSNAAYWFRHVGNHPAFPEIAIRVSKVLEANGNPAWAGKLLARRSWDALAFITLCESTAGKSSDDPQVTLLREIQAVETEVLLEHFLRAHS
jgi:hypothetical protein